MAPAFGKRYADRFRVTHTWERIQEQTSYAPRAEITAALPERIEDQIFANIVEKGLWLQRAVADRWPICDDLARLLTSHAELNNLCYGDSSRERIAAAYMLWPYHSARYYGHLEADTEARLDSRTALCQIQGILYNNIRAVMDVLRLWFHSSSDRDTIAFVADPEKRIMWRSATLTNNVPDLCAIDQLVQHLMSLIRARPLIRKAIETIQALSVKDLDPAAVADTVLGAFREVQIAQMTVFYHPNPMDLRDRDDIPLYELVHETRDMDPIPAKLIPFEGEGDERLAQNFRKLASTIYSIQNKEDFPSFSAHRYSTISRLNDTTSFISDGEITNYFLSTKPPVGTSPENVASNGTCQNQVIWPLWYKQALSDFDFDKGFRDWSDHFWWSPVELHELEQALFPGPNGAVHQNDHRSAYWDQRALTKKIFIDEIKIPPEHPTGEPTFGYLMELLLRRESKTRTSFFFALAQTYERQGRLCQFVGGTFLGLELPGVPFSKERFEAIASRVRGLVMAVAHYTTTHAYKTVRLQAAQERKNFEQRVSLIRRLLKGDERVPRFKRNGYLLFASPLRNGRTDHDYLPQDEIGWKPSLFQIKFVFQGARHLSELPRTSRPRRGCYDTWKALFYLGGTADTHNRLTAFLTHWSAYQQAGAEHATNLADRSVVCQDCFEAALEFLLSEEWYAGLKPKIKIEVPIDLPSRPGIRFLIALCRFILDVESQASPENTQITEIQFLPSSVIIDFDKPKLLETVFSKKQHYIPNFIHTTGIFMNLETVNTMLVKNERDIWGRFLNNPQFSSQLNMQYENDWKRLLISWKA
jgi:hypothetical protein